MTCRGNKITAADTGAEPPDPCGRAHRILRIKSGGNAIIAGHDNDVLTGVKSVRKSCFKMFKCRPVVGAAVAANRRGHGAFFSSELSSQRKA